MGRRGPDAFANDRKPTANQRASGRNGGKYRGVEEGNARYWDLLLGYNSRGERVWTDPKDPERAAAWEDWRERIRRRWPFSWSYGQRPDAWFDFDLPKAIARARRAKQPAEFCAARAAWAESLGDVDASEEELVYWFDAGEAERRDIEETWARNIEHARDFGGKTTPEAVRQHAIESWGVPGWFYDRQTRGSAAETRGAA